MVHTGQCEEAQGLGRKCMHHCLGLTRMEIPTHNQCAIQCFAVRARRSVATQSMEFVRFAVVSNHYLSMGR